MENLEVMVVLFIIVILGYVACKLGYMGDKFDKKLSSIVVDITCPLLEKNCPTARSSSRFWA